MNVCGIDIDYVNEPVCQSELTRYQQAEKKNARTKVVLRQSLLHDD